MTRPTRQTIPTGQGWNADVDTNFIQLYDRPTVPYVHSGDLASLEAAYPAAQYEHCMCWVDHTGASSPGQTLAVSVDENGTFAWRYIANWQANRANPPVVNPASPYSVGWPDDLVVKSNSTALTSDLPAITDAQRGRQIRFVNMAGTTNDHTVDANSDTIEGSTTLVLTPGSYALLQAPDTGTDWIRLS